MTDHDRDERTHRRKRCPEHALLHSSSSFFSSLPAGRTLLIPEPPPTPYATCARVSLFSTWHAPSSSLPDATQWAMSPISVGASPRPVYLSPGTLFPPPPSAGDEWQCHDRSGTPACGGESCMSPSEHAPTPCHRSGSL